MSWGRRGAEPQLPGDRVGTGFERRNAIILKMSANAVCAAPLDIHASQWPLHPGGGLQPRLAHPSQDSCATGASTIFVRECGECRGRAAVSAVCSAALALYITIEEPNIMKVISITALAFVAAAMLSGCNKSDDNTPPAPSSASTAATAPASTAAAPAAAPADATPPAASTAAPAAAGTAAPASTSTASGQ